MDPARIAKTGAQHRARVWAKTTEVLRMLKKQPFPIDKIHVPVKRVKTLDPAKVDEIANDILENGQITPISVRADRDRFVLIEGYHRLEAMRALGEAEITGYLVRARLR